MSSTLISVEGLERKLRAILGISRSQILQTTEDARGLIVIEQDRPEWAFPGGEYLFAAELQQPAVAAVFGWVGLANPANSGMLAIVEQVQNNFGAFVSIGSQEAMPGFIAGQRDDDYSRDKRYRGLSVCEIQRGTNAVAQLTTVRHHHTNGTAVPYKGSIILPPGFFAIVEGTAVNTLVDASFAWRERPLEGRVGLP